MERRLRKPEGRGVKSKTVDGGKIRLSGRVSSFLSDTAAEERAVKRKRKDKPNREKLNFVHCHFEIGQNFI